MTVLRTTSVPDWALLRRLVDTEGRPPAWRSAGAWALEVLAEEMGEDWPARWWRKRRRLPSELTQATYLPAAFASLLELALRLRAFRATAGIAPVRRHLASDLREERMLHTAVQLELCSLGMEEGLDVALEAPMAGRDDPVDVRLRLPGGQMGIETFVVLKDQGTRDAEGYMSDVGRRLDEICWPLGVDVDGALEVRMAPGDTDLWLREVERAARRAAGSRQPQVVDWPAAYVTVYSIGTARQTSFIGPVERGEGWPRLVAILQKKARQAGRSGASWLRLDVQDGMFQLTDWSRLDLSGKLVVLAEHMPYALDGADWLDGIVVTSGACQMAGDVAEDEARGEHGVRALRRQLPLGRARETFILPAGARATEAAAIWSNLYDREPRWLDHALELAGLPSADEIRPC